MLRLRKIILLFLFVVIGTVTALIIGEISLRFYFYGAPTLPDLNSGSDLRIAHRTRGWTLAPSKSAWYQTVDYQILVETNSKGLRDDEHSYSKDQNTYRIVLLGDSYMEAYQVDFEESLSKLLETILTSKEKKVEVINLGVGGYGTTQQYLYLIEEGLSYQPDMILLGFYPGNDLQNNSRILEMQLWQKEKVKTWGRPYGKIDTNGGLTVEKPDAQRIFHEYNARDKNRLKHTSNATYLTRLIESSVTFSILKLFLSERSWLSEYDFEFDPNIQFGYLLTNFIPEYHSKSLTSNEYHSAWDSSWNVTLALFSAIDTLAKKEDIPLVIFNIPSELEYDLNLQKRIKSKYPKLNFDFSLASNRLQKELANKILYIDLLTIFRKAYHEKHPLTYQLQDHHWNASGHRLASNHIAKHLKKLIHPDS